jgi:hypothetical protein
MNLAGTPRHRSWGHVFTSEPVEEEQTGVVTRRDQLIDGSRGHQMQAAVGMVTGYPRMAQLAGRTLRMWASR